MDTNDAVRQRLKELLAARQLTVADLCRIDNRIKASTISDFLHGRNKSFSISTLDRICHAMDISIQVFFDDEAFTKQTPMQTFK